MDTAPPNAWLAMVRALHVASCLLVCAVWFFDGIIVARPARRRFPSRLLWGQPSPR